MYTALIDGGEVCFRVSAGAQIRRWLIYETGVKHSDDWIRSYQYKKDADDWINRYDTRSAEDKDEEPWFWCVLDIQPTSERFALTNTKKFIDKIAKKLRTDDIIICFGSNQGKNFRDDLATFQVYKDRPKEKPFHYSAVKSYIEKHYATVDTTLPLEDDDVLASLATDLQAQNKTPVICSHDKDMKQVPGMHLNTDSLELFEVSAVEGLRNFYKQLISGDPTDTIPGLYQITGKKNNKKYAELLESFEYNKDMYEFVRGIYLGALSDFKVAHPYGTEDLDCILWEIGNLLYLKRNWTEEWKIPV